MDCLFCQIIKGELPSSKIYEDDQVLSFLDINPVNKGHALVVPKVHSADILDTDDEVLKQLAVPIKKISKAVLATTGADGFNLGCNNGQVAGQVVFHLHFHIMPRFSNDGLKLWTGKKYAEGEMAKLAEEIRKNF